MFNKRTLIGLILIAIIVVVAILVYPYLQPAEEASREAQAVQICPELDVESADSDVKCFEIVQAESEVRFTLDEELGGQPTTVVGTTQDVAGQIVIDVENPANSQIGPIEINLRTLATNNDRRNRAIQIRILKSDEDQYEFTIFTPTSIDGLPDSVTVGEPFTFTVTGELPLVDVTQTVTWEMTVTPVSETRIEGYGQTQVLRSDYDISIPDVPSVANVTDEVLLEIEFVAVEIDPAAQAIDVTDTPEEES